MSAAPFDVIVIGLGAMGSATSYHLAKRGERVLGLDTYAPGHANGSSHGQSRIIRKAYLEGSGYVPLVLRAYDLWRELEAETGKDLLTITGGLMLGAPETITVAGALESARVHGLAHEDLSADEVRYRFPGLRPGDDLRAVYEPDAGTLNAEACVRAHLDLAATHGATLRHNERVLTWTTEGEGGCVVTAEGEYRADRLVVTVGPWTSEILADLQLPLSFWRVFVTHFTPLDEEKYVPPHCPVYIWEVPEGTYYGFPLLPGQGVKVGRHDIGEITTAETMRRQISDDDTEMLRAFLNRYMPDAAGPVDRALTCMYTNTPDRHFVIDRHPELSNVVYAAGFSGHGFKFSSAIGEALADLSMTGASRFDLEFLSPNRFR